MTQNTATKRLLKATILTATGYRMLSSFRGSFDGLRTELTDQHSICIQQHGKHRQYIGFNGLQTMKYIF